MTPLELAVGIVVLIAIAAIGQLVHWLISRVFRDRLKEEEDRDDGYRISFFSASHERHDLLAQAVSWGPEQHDYFVFYIARLIRPSASMEAFMEEFGDVQKFQKRQFTVSCPAGERVIILSPLLTQVGVSVASGDMMISESIRGEYRDTVQLGKEARHIHEQGVEDG